MRFMMIVFVMVAVVLSGCVSSGLKVQDGLVIRTAGETNLFRPSLSVMQVLTCHEDPAGVEQMILVDGQETRCRGRFLPMATVQGTQAGALTGLGGAMIQGGAIVGGAYLLGDGIRDSASTTNVTQEGGGASAQGFGGNGGIATGGQAISHSTSKSHSYSSSMSTVGRGRD